MSLVLNGTDGVQFNDSSLQGAAASPYGIKNRIINGDMRIDQRNAGASVTPTDGSYTLDRWVFKLTQASKLTVQQNAGSVTTQAGFPNYMGITSSSAYSINSTDIFAVRQSIEGFNFADLDFGTANAKTVTLSFWVRSSLTGTFGGSLTNYNASRSYPFSYTISAANTWEQKSVTITGDTSGTWVGSSSSGSASVWFGLGVGSTNSGTAGSWSSNDFRSATGATSVVGTNGATFYITGVQLEVGSTATPFERRLYGQELINCQRYYWKITEDDGFTGIVNVAANSTADVYGVFQFPVAMRTSPTGSYGSALSDFRVQSAAGSATPTSITFQDTTVYGAVINAGGSFTAGQAGWISFNGTNAGLTDYIDWSAEL